MEKNTIIGIVLGVILVVAVVQTLELQYIKGARSTGAAVASGVGETYEQMMARMHPDQVRAANNVPPQLQNLPKQVGGC